MQENNYLFRHKANIINASLYSRYVENSHEAHSKRVSILCEMAGTAVQLPKTEISKLRISGLYHDIGKKAIDKKILNKKGSLTVKEWNEIKRHPVIGYNILCSTLHMPEVAQYVLYHHERYDGKGYPKGLKQKEIPLMSRILSIVDAYDAMTNCRVYKETLNKDEAIQELIYNKGKQFDPDLVDIIIEKVLNRIV